MFTIIVVILTVIIIFLCVVMFYSKSKTDVKSSSSSKSSTSSLPTAAAATAAAPVTTKTTTTPQSQHHVKTSQVLKARMEHVVEEIKCLRKALDPLADKLDRILSSVSSPSLVKKVEDTVTEHHNAVVKYATTKEREVKNFYKELTQNTNMTENLRMMSAFVDKLAESNYPHDVAKTFFTIQKLCDRIDKFESSTKTDFASRLFVEDEN